MHTTRLISTFISAAVPRDMLVSFSPLLNKYYILNIILKKIKYNYKYIIKKLKYIIIY